MDSEFKPPTGRRELKIGESLKNNGTSFHGIKYDFKPNNEKFEESAVMEIKPTNQVSLKHSQKDNGSCDFMYSGTMRQFSKEYFLVIDHVTGDVTLEKLTANIQLKRTKVINPANKQKYQNVKKQEPEKVIANSPASPQTNTLPSTSKKKTKRKQKFKNSPVTDPQTVNKKYGLIPQHSPIHPSPSRTSPENKNPNNVDCKSLSHISQTAPNSIDDDESSMTGYESKFPILPELTNILQPESEFGLPAPHEMIGDISDSSSDSSSDSDSNSDSSSSSSSTCSDKKRKQNRVNGYSNGNSPNALKGQLLNEDLQLSETGSDSD